MKIIHLNEETALANINHLIEINKVLDLESWTVDNFLMDLYGKWEYSLSALENNQIVGFLICSVKKSNILHIHKIAVLPKYQRKKIGSTLLKHLFIKAYESNIEEITVKVKKSNINAQRFYEQLGFKKITSNGCRYTYGRLI